MEILQMDRLTQLEKIKAIIDLQRFLSELTIEYPKHNIWFDRMIKSMFKECDRKILLAVENQSIIGATILKDTAIEKKICTIRVDKKYQKMGIGKSLVIKSMEELSIDKPIITVSSTKNREFLSLFKYFGFQLEATYVNKYKRDTWEYVYNGILLPETLLKPEKEGLFLTNKYSFNKNLKGDQKVGIMV